MSICDKCTHRIVCDHENAYRRQCMFFEESRPHGEWIEHRQYYMNYFVSEYECSNCRDEVWQKTEWQFCPNCGASMKEGESE